jgi:transcription elongation GreA/GreB family factor
MNAGYTLIFEDSATPNNRISIEPKIGLSFYGKEK